jgi:sulfur carrier protein
VNVFINQIAHQLADGATLADAITLLQARPPFAAAVNLQFIPKSSYAKQVLQADDRIDIIAPVTGG